MVSGLISSFLGSEKLQRHIDFLYKKGSLYRYYNKTLMFHGCIPLNPDGSCTEVEFYGQRVKARSLFDFCETLVREARFAKNSETRKRGSDFMWYLWCGPKSPLFARFGNAAVKKRAPDGCSFDRVQNVTVRGGALKDAKTAVAFGAGL